MSSLGTRSRRPATAITKRPCAVVSRVGGRVVCVGWARRSGRGPGVGLGTLLSAAGWSLVSHATYGESVYFTIINMTTVGFGEVNPNHVASLEGIAALNSVVGLLLFGLVVASVQAALQPSSSTGGDSGAASILKSLLARLELVAGGAKDQRKAGKNRAKPQDRGTDVADAPAQSTIEAHEQRIGSLVQQLPGECRGIRGIAVSAHGMLDGGRQGEVYVRVHVRPED